MSAIIERLQKVLRLAQGGTGGEADNAQRQLDAMLRKHGMTLADITDEDDVLVEARFDCASDAAERLVVQIVGRVMDTSHTTFYTYRSKRKKIFCKLPRAKMLEAQLHYAILLPALLASLNLAFRAFVMANNIYPQTTENEERELTLAQKQELLRIAEISKGMERPQIHTAITQGAA